MSGALELIGFGLIVAAAATVSLGLALAAGGVLSLAVAWRLDRRGGG